MNRALVTGAGGFIGRELVAALRARGVSAVGVRREAAPIARTVDDSSWRIGDVTERETLRGICRNIDTVFHLAGHTHVTGESASSAGERHRRITLEGTIHMLDEARTAGVERFIFTSSVKAMGELTEGRADETTEPRPSTPYGRAKLAAEQAVLERGRSGMHVCVLRLPMVYGPGQRGNFAAMVAAIDRGWFPPLPEVGNRRSLVHVRDVVQALLLAATTATAAGKVYLVTDGEAYSTRRMYDMIRAALGRAPAHWSIPAAALRFAAALGDVVGQWSLPFPLDSQRLAKILGSAWYGHDKIERELGYRPRYDLANALPEIVAAYRAIDRRRAASF